jgi:hypothetical protein
MYKKSFKLFITGYMQVFLVAISTLAIANRVYPLAALVSYCIGWLWQSNVKRAVANSSVDIHLYNLGSATGTVSGIYLVSFFIK